MCRTSASSANVVPAHAWERPLGIAHSPPAFSWLRPHAGEGERPADMGVFNRTLGQAAGPHKNPRASSPPDQPELVPMVPGSCAGGPFRGAIES